MLFKPKAEIRKHYFLNQYVIITPSRSKRPRDIHEESVIKKTDSCVLCPDQVEKNLILAYVGGKINWDVMILKNKFPAVTLDNPKAYGTQEVIIETPEHGTEMQDFSVTKIERVLKVYAKRTEAASQNKKIDYILVFKNNGSKAGASLHHSHSQVFATQMLPPHVLDELTAAQNYQTEHGTCVYCDTIKDEMKGKRKIYEDKHVAAFAPFASEYHYESWIFPKRHLDNITKMNRHEFRSFATCLKHILSRLHRLNLAYNFSLHQVISNANQHFYLKIQPRDSVWAGVELNAGMIINSVPPEEAAKFLRK